MTGGRLIIGKITAAHGIRGELTVFPLTDDPRRFLKLKKVYLCDMNGRNAVLKNVKKARIDKERVILSFEDIPDRNGAQTLKGLFLSVDREDAVALKEGSFFIEDLKGLSVVDEKKGNLGKVKELIKTGNRHVVAVKRPGKPDLLIPFVNEIFPEVDLADGVMRCKLPEGLYELYEV